MVCPHKVVEIDDNSLPFAGRFREQTVLVQIGGHDRVGLKIHKVFPAVGLYAEGEVGVRVDVPERSAEEGRSSIQRAPACVAGAHNLWVIRREGYGYGAVEMGVGGFRAGGRDKVEIGGREGAQVSIGHALAQGGRVWVGEGDEWERFGLGFDRFEFDRDGGLSSELLQRAFPEAGRREKASCALHCGG